MKRPQKTEDIKLGANVQITGNRCYRCDHEWKPRIMEPRAKVCPKCKSPYWDRERMKRKDSAKR